MSWGVRWDRLPSPKPKPVKIPRAKSELEETLALLLAANNIKFVREFSFAHRKWRFDFLIEGIVCVDCQGGIWNRGAHVRGKRYLEDCAKLNTATIMGYKVLHVCKEHIDNGMAAEWIKALIGPIAR